MIVSLLVGLGASLALWSSGYLWGLRQHVPKVRRRTNGLSVVQMEEELRDDSTFGSDRLAELVRSAVASIHPSDAAFSLGKVGGSYDDRTKLPALLKAVAEEASLSQIVLSDEAGLMIAMVGDHDRGETLAATSSVLLSLVDRLATHDIPQPVGAVIEDTQCQQVMHRIFRTRDERFVLTAVTMGQRLTPRSLDTAVARIEMLLQTATGRGRFRDAPNGDTPDADIRFG
ncbi:MAG: hypothetical protein HC923_01235 [Myxococcales bacterium]|nr:hypothetical protein [Myxococcales bacterium]